METLSTHESTKVKAPLEIDACPDCNSHCLIEDTHRGELICSNCGVVIERGTFDFSEKRAYSSEEIENRKQNGAPITALTHISWTNVMGVTSKNASACLKRAARWNSCMSWDKKNLLMAVTEIKRVCSALAVPHIIPEAAATYYRKVQKMNRRMWHNRGHAPLPHQGIQRPPPQIRPHRSISRPIKRSVITSSRHGLARGGPKTTSIMIHNQSGVCSDRSRHT
jgi:hypothetical protein